MFTSETEHFGVWKSQREKSNGTKIRLLAMFLYSLGISSVIIWLIVFSLMKMKRDFFLIESHPISYDSVQGGESFFHKNRDATLSLLVFEKEGENHLVFSTGEHFLLEEKQDWLLGLA